MPNGVSDVTSPFVTPEGRLYFASAGVTAVVASGPTFELLAANDLGDAGSASAAVAGGRIFLKGKRKLHCIGMRQREE